MSLLLLLSLISLILLFSLILILLFSLIPLIPLIPYSLYFPQPSPSSTLISPGGTPSYITLPPRVIIIPLAPA